MIADKDRSGYFGASDTHFIMGSFETETFKDFWKVKKGEIEMNIDNIYVKTGNVYEKPILNQLEKDLDIELEYDKQVIVEDLRLRVNLDSNTKDTIYECKTFKNLIFGKIPVAYEQQVIVQMFATGLRKAYIIGYKLEEEDYESAIVDKTALPIDAYRLSSHKIEYKEWWIENEYLPRLKYLVNCLNNDIQPTNNGYLETLSAPKFEGGYELSCVEKNITTLTKQLKEWEEKKKELEQKAIEYMETYGIKSIENDYIKATYVAPTLRKSIDTKELKEQMPEIAEQFTRETVTKPSLRITLK